MDFYQTMVYSTYGTIVESIDVSPKKKKTIGAIAYCILTITINLVSQKILRLLILLIVLGDLVHDKRGVSDKPKRTLVQEHK